MRTHTPLAEILRDWPAFLNDVFREDLGDNELLDASDPLDRRLNLLGQILANPKARHSAKLVVTCPQGDPMLRVYIVEGEAMFVPARTLQFGVTFDPGAVPDQESSKITWAADQIRQQIAQTGKTVQAQCQHRFREIPRQWLLDRLAEGRHGATFAD